MRELKHLLHAHPGPERVPQIKNPLGVGHHQLVGDELHLFVAKFPVKHARFRLEHLVGLDEIAPVRAEPEAFDLKGPQRLLETLLERAPDRHGFPHAFHLRGERGVGLRENFRTRSAPRKLSGLVTT